MSSPIFISSHPFPPILLDLAFRGLFPCAYIRLHCHSPILLIFFSCLVIVLPFRFQISYFLFCFAERFFR